MAAVIQSFDLRGIDAFPVTIAVDSGMVKVSGGIHADAACMSPARLLTLCESTLATTPRESLQSQPDPQSGRVLYGRHDAPAELPKSAGLFDLPIAVGILAGSRPYRATWLKQDDIVSFRPAG